MAQQKLNPIPNGKTIEHQSIKDILNMDSILILGNLVGEFSDFKVSKDGVYIAELPTKSPAKTEYFLSFLNRILDPSKKTLIWTSDKERVYFSSLIYEAVVVQGEEFTKSFTQVKAGKKEYRYTSVSNPKVRFNVYLDDKGRCTRIIGENFIIGKYGKTSFTNETEISKSFKGLDKSIKNLGGKMYFDGAIMNPPYDVNLHLKILSEVLKRTDEVVNLSPIRWLQDPLATYKRSGSDYQKFEQSVSRRIESLDIIDHKDATAFFGALFSQDLGVYKFSKTGGFDYDSVPFRNGKLASVHKKIINKSILDNIMSHTDENAVEGIRVKVQKLKNYAPSSSKGPLVNVNWAVNPSDFDLMYKNFSSTFVDGYGTDDSHKWWSQYGNKNKYTKDVGEPIPYSVKFKTLDEAKNFEDFCWTTLFKYCMYMYKIDQNVPLKYLPFMPTYEKKWTDDELRTYFDITDDEWSEINEVMKPYI